MNLTFYALAGVRDHLDRWLVAVPLDARLVEPARPKLGQPRRTVLRAGLAGPAGGRAGPDPGQGDAPASARPSSRCTTSSSTTAPRRRQRADPEGPGSGARRILPLLGEDHHRRPGGVAGVLRSGRAQPRTVDHPAPRVGRRRVARRRSQIGPAIWAASTPSDEIAGDSTTPADSTFRHWNQTTRHPERCGVRRLRRRTAGRPEHPGPARPAAGSGCERGRVQWPAGSSVSRDQNQPAVTCTVSAAVTPGCSLTDTGCDPTVLM